MSRMLINRITDRIESKSLLEHPFYQEWKEGNLTQEELKVYAAQYYHFESSFPLYLSSVHSRCDEREVRQSILENLWDEEHGEVNHRAMWLDFCESLGLKRDEPETTEPLAKTQALLDTYHAICNDGTFQEGLAAIYAYEEQVPEIMIEKIRGLKDHFNITSEKALRFFEVHSVLDEDHSEKEREGIVNYTKTNDEAAVEKALQKALDGWWGFLDGVMEESRAA
ncbi:MAG: CADD family putative folate metabolism protein [Dehalococcoidia bacterium]